MTNEVGLSHSKDLSEPVHAPPTEATQEALDKLRLPQDYLPRHCMLDTETMGVNPNSPIVQIGLVFFTVEGIYLKLKLTVDFEDVMKYGKPDGSTVKWWLGQSKEAQNSILENARPINEVADIYEKVIASQQADYYWSHATFDFPIVKSWLLELGRKDPLPFRKCYDMRTLEYLAGDKIQWEPRKGTHHDAEADAVFQAEHAIKMLNVLGAK